MSSSRAKGLNCKHSIEAKLLAWYDRMINRRFKKKRTVPSSRSDATQSGGYIFFFFGAVCRLHLQSIFLPDYTTLHTRWYPSSIPVLACGGWKHHEIRMLVSHSPAHYLNPGPTKYDAKILAPTWPWRSVTTRTIPSDLNLSVFFI